MSFLVIVALIATCQISWSHVAVILFELVSELFQFSVSSYTSNWKKLRLYVYNKAYNKRLRRANEKDWFVLSILSYLSNCDWYWRTFFFEI